MGVGGGGGGGVGVVGCGVGFGVGLGVGVGFGGVGVGGGGDGGGVGGGGVGFGVGGGVGFGVGGEGGGVGFGVGGGVGGGGVGSGGGGVGVGGGTGPHGCGCGVGAGVGGTGVGGGAGVGFGVPQHAVCPCGQVPSLNRNWQKHPPGLALLHSGAIIWQSPCVLDVHGGSWQQLESRSAGTAAGIAGSGGQPRSVEEARAADSTRRKASIHPPGKVPAIFGVVCSRTPRACRRKHVTSSNSNASHSRSTLQLLVRG